MKTNIILTSLLLSSLPLMAGQPDKAAPDPVPKKNDWEFIASVYLWAMGLDGTTGVANVQVDVDLGFGDIVGNLDFAFMGTLELRRGRWGLTTDLQYSELSGSATGTGGVLLGGEMGLNQFLGNFYLSYRFVESEKSVFDVIAGTRVNSLNIDLNLAGAGGRVVSASDEQAWADAVVGFRTRVFIKGPWFVQAAGDIGGGSSDITWQALGLIGYKLNDHCTIGAGYRAIGTDYSNGGFTYDIVSHGPILGLQWRF